MDASAEFFATVGGSEMVDLKKHPSSISMPAITATIFVSFLPWLPRFVGEFNEHSGVKRLNELQLSSQETSTWKAQAEGISQR